MTTPTQLPRETKGAFRAFRVFIDLGRERSLREVAIRCTCSNSYIRRLSRTWQWMARAREHDAALDRVAHEAEELKLQQSAGVWAVRMSKTREEAFVMAEKMMAKANEMLLFPVSERVMKDGKTVIKPMKWTAADLSRLVEVAQRLKNLSTGLPTEHHEVTGPDKGPIPVSVPSVVFYIPKSKRDE